LLNLEIKQYSVLDIFLGSLFACIVILMWYAGNYHSLHHGDTLIPVFNSLYRWQPFAWEHARIGSLFQLLTSQIRNPVHALVALNFIYTFFYFSSFALWVTLFVGKFRYYEAMIAVGLILPFLFPTGILFNVSAPSVGNVTASLFFLGLYIIVYERMQRNRSQMIVLVLIGFLSIYLFVSFLVFLICLSIRNAIYDGGKVQDFVVNGFYSFMIYGLYKLVELTSPFTPRAYSIQLSNIIDGALKLLQNYPNEFHSDTVFIVFCVLAVFSVIFSLRHQDFNRNIILAFLVASSIYFGVISSSTHVAQNVYSSRYLLPITVPVTCLITAVFLFLLYRRFSSILPYLKLVLFLLFLFVNLFPFSSLMRKSVDENVLEWRLRGLAEISAHQLAENLIEADCDFFVSSAWKAWPSTFLANQHYFDSQILDERTDSTRIVIAIAFHTLGWRDVWYPRLSWRDLSICRLIDDPDFDWARDAYLNGYDLESVETIGIIHVLRVNH
jgi:hypothetical protein